MKRIFYIIFILLFSLKAGIAKENDSLSISFHAEYASFSKVYYEKEYKENNSTFFSVPMINIGSEIRYKTGLITGGAGYAYNKIYSGRVFNNDHYEIQNEKITSLPYFFTGSDSGLFCLELGIGYYISKESRGTRYYYKPSGRVVDSDHDKPEIDRNDSFALVNFLFRLFPEEKYHFKIRYGREQFNIIDSLFNIAFAYPYRIHKFEIYFSLPADLTDYHPQSNQRTGVVYSVNIKAVTLSVTAGYLSFNHRGGGDGNMWIFDPANFSCGSGIGVCM